MEENVEVAASDEPAASSLPSQGPKLKRPVKPDVKEHKAAIEQLQAEMQKRRSRLDEIKQKLDRKRQAGPSAEVQEARAKLNELSGKFKAELEKKKAIREELNSLNKTRDSTRAKLRELKTKVGSMSTVKAVDERIAGLEYRITHHTLDLKEENRTHEEMKKLEGLKPTVELFSREQQNLDASDRVRGEYMSKLKAYDEQLNAIKDEEEKQRLLFNELRNKEADKSEDMPSLIKEREECREVCNALWEKITEMRSEHKARHNQFFEEHKAWNAQQQEERRLKQIAWEKEKSDKDAAYKAAAQEFAGEPYHKEIGLCEQLITHLSKYKQGDLQETVVEAKAPAASSEFSNMKAMNKKNDDIVDNGFGAFLGSGPKKGKGKKGKSAVASQGQADQKLNHSLDIIGAFGKLKVAMPSKSSKVPEALREVEERKAYWLKKRAQAKETGVVAEEPEASSSKPKAARASQPAKAKANGSLNLSAEEWPDFAGNVTQAAASGKGATDSLVTVTLSVEGEAVKLACTAT